MLIYFIFIFVNTFLKTSSAKCIVSGYDLFNLEYRNQGNPFQPNSFHIINSIDYDHNNSQILASSTNQTIIKFNILNKNFTTLVTSNSINSILSVNKSHFLTGGDDNLVFYNILNDSFYPVVGPIGFYGSISCLKLLKTDNLILIGTLDYKILVYDLSIDYLDRNFIVSQCSPQWICVFKLELDNSLTQIIIGNFNTVIDIISIKIIDDSLIMIGLEHNNESYICMWNLKDGTLMYDGSGSKVMNIEVFDSNRIIYGQENGQLNLLELSEFTVKIFLYPSSIYDLETIENCDATSLYKYFLLESTPWNSFINISFKTFPPFTTTRIEDETTIISTDTKLAGNTLINEVSKSSDIYNYFTTSESTLEKNTFLSATYQSFSTENLFTSTISQNVEKESSYKKSFAST
ncbi:unnamed protein product, partial [Brachionus calyciflorus]